MYFSHLIFVLALYSATVDGTPSTGYIHYGPAHGSLKIHGPADWRTARLKCFADGAVLASPENTDLLYAMIEAIGTNTPAHYEYVFTGVHNTFSNRFFNSLEGTPLSQLASYGKHDGALSSENEDSCLKIDKTGLLFLSKCTEQLPFVCYKKDPPAKTTLDCGPNGYTLSKETSSCYKFHKEYAYWHEAFAACAEEDAHLAIINSQEESEVLKELFLENQDGRNTNKAVFTDVVHVGFVDWGKEGGLWMTIEGQTIESAGFAKWSGQEPNNRTNQFCGGMYDDGNFDDVNCSDGDPDGKYRSFICEKNPETKTELTKSDNINFH